MRFLESAGAVHERGHVRPARRPRTWTRPWRPASADPTWRLASWLEVEGLARDVVSGVHPGHERAHLAPGDLLDCPNEVVLAHVLEVHTQVAPALLLLL